MAGEMIKEFLVGLGFQVNEGQLGNFKNSIQNATLAVGAVSAAITAAAGAVAGFVASIADTYDELGDLSDRTNTSARALAEFGYIAQLTGSDTQTAYASIENLSRIAGEAAQGIGRGAAIFEQLGLSAKDSKGALKDTTALLDEIKVRIAGLGRGEQIAILERLGLDRTLIGAMTQDLSELRANFNAFYDGIDFDEATAKAGDFNDAMDNLKEAIKGIKATIGLRFMGQLVDGVNTARRVIMENKGRIIAAITPVIDMVLRIGEALVHLVGVVGNVASRIIIWFNDLNAATDGWAARIIALAVAWRYLSKAFLASPIGVILALGAAIALLVEDFLVWKAGGDSLIDWSKWKPGIDAATEAVTFFRDELKAAFTVIIAAVDALIKVLRGDFTGAWNAVKEVVASVSNVFENTWKAWSKLGQAASSFGSAVRGSLGFLGIGGKAATGAAPLAPSPSQAAQLSPQQNVNQKTEIHILGAGSPEATARAVAGQQSRVNADLVRNLRGATK